MGVNQRYKIKIDTEQPSDEELNQHKSFNRVLYQYNRSKTRQPLHHVVYKMNKLIPIIAVAIFIIMIVMYYHKFKNKNNQPKEPQNIEEIQTIRPEGWIKYIPKDHKLT